MKLTRPKLFLVFLSMALLIGCDKPAADSSDDTVEPPTVSIPDDAVEISIDVDDPTQSNALTAEAGVAPAKVKAGDTVTFAVRAKTADRWHIYAFDHDGIGNPTKLELQLPAGIEKEGEWRAPESKPYASVSPSLVYEGDIMFQQTLKIAENAAPGPREVKCTLAYQTCNDQLCNPPASMELSATVEVE